MRDITLLTVLTLTGSMLLLPDQTNAQDSAQDRMKCWINSEYIKECGNNVPPEYVQQGYQELGKDGIVRDGIKRAKTDEELLEEKRLAKLKKEEKRKLEKLEKLDNILLETFTSVEDIERVRDDHLATIETTIKLTLTRNKKIRADLDNRIKIAANQERVGITPPEELIEDIKSLRRQIKNNNLFINEKHAEKEEIKKSYTADIQRYKKLKGII